MDVDKRYQNLDTSYTCDNCGFVVTEVPRHCGHPMHLEELNEGVEWVCWMGASCGHKEYSPNCDASTIPIYETINT